MYLVDTNVIAAGAPSKRSADSRLITWMDVHSSELYLSVVTVAEIEDGIAKSHRENSMRKADDLAAWLEVVLHLYESRILAFDIAAARLAGALSGIARSRGIAPGFADLIIGATARCHVLTILTRNVRHFKPLGLLTINPFEHLPKE